MLLIYLYYNCVLCIIYTCVCPPGEMAASGFRGGNIQDVSRISYAVKMDVTKHHYSSFKKMQKPT